jgi:CRP/FNR family transcriptional regulator, anaerobic regulatory protein
LLRTRRHRFGTGGPVIPWKGQIVNVLPILKEPFIGRAQCISSCAACPAHDLGLCHGMSEMANGRYCAPPALLPMTEQTIPARRVIFRQRDMHDFVPFICQGWASSTVTLSDGSRQILLFLLPGDIVSPSLLFGPTAHCSVEAITEVQYRSFRRDDLKALLTKDLALIEKIAKVWTDRKLRAQQLAVDLGRRTADERIARLILSLRDRLASRGMVQDQTMDFPLRQHHVADATGLTAVHVSKVLSEFRRRGLIDISDRSLTVLNTSEFQRVATMR